MSERSYHRATSRSIHILGASLNTYILLLPLHVTLVNLQTLTFIVVCFVFVFCGEFWGCCFLNLEHTHTHTHKTHPKNLHKTNKKLNKNTKKNIQSTKTTSQIFKLKQKRVQCITTRCNLSCHP